ANDVMYGGLDNDAMHGGAGDDAMSGAEAPAVSYLDNYNIDGSLLTAHIRSDFAHPFNPGNALGYSPALTYQAQYDPNDPFREITLNADGSLNKSTAGGDQWFLNFDSSPAAAPFDTIYDVAAPYLNSARTDGNDALFGDMGNDWLVGGTGRDAMFGGWGNDYLNADDVLTTGGSVANVGTDTNPSYEDIAFGGAGRDVLVSNTGGDRLIDWSGEFDSYLTPFAPFGMATVSRTIQPQLPEYLYALSAAEGADPFLAAQYGSDPARNGEPFGELGIVTQKDAAWGDQRGKPRDPQAGNSPGVQRDVLRTSGTVIFLAPGTDPPAGGGALGVAPAAPVIQMATFVSSGDQTLAPLVISGAVGSTVSYTLSNGTKSVSGSGLIGNDGNLSILIDVSSLTDGNVTATATLTLGGKTSAPGSTTAVKNTVVPGSVGLALPGYVGAAGIKTSSLVLSGNPGYYVYYELDGPSAMADSGYFDSTGKFVVTLDFSSYPDGTYFVNTWQLDPYGNMSPVGLSTPTETLDTVAPTGGFSTSATLTNNPAFTLSLSYSDNAGGTGLNQMRVSYNGGSTWTAWQAYSSSYNATLPSLDGTYSVVVQVADKAGNYVLTTRQVILDRTPPAVTPTVSAPNNGTFYDVGTKVVLTWTATDLNGVRSTSGSVEGQTISASGGTIDVDVLTAGVHTVTITSTDNAGNVTTKSITFTIHPTAAGLLNAVNDGVARGWITTSFGATLVSQIQQIIKAAGSSSANVRAKINQLISTLQYPPTGGITAAYRTLMLNWANDLLSRT
ncbi:MAG TPA: Ig-like domain repeat protein, partial [Mycobacteriales bacterium]|nr:Ig-like domain repeat protein [Mycobacteriales bacterium]